jgi:hypothetical protein
MPNLYVIYWEWPDGTYEPYTILTEKEITEEEFLNEFKDCKQETEFNQEYKVRAFKMTTLKEYV